MGAVLNPTFPFCDVIVLPKADGTREIVAAILPNFEERLPEIKRKVVLALDASRSMKCLYGSTVFGNDPNLVENFAHRIGNILLKECHLADQLSLLYWALGTTRPGELEIVGEFDRADFESLEIRGPTGRAWGTHTHLLPVLKYIAETTDADSEWTMGLILTDGFIEDEAACMAYCTLLGKRLKQEISEGKRTKDSFQFCMISIGTEVDRNQLERFEDSLGMDLFTCFAVENIGYEADVVAGVYGDLMYAADRLGPPGSIWDSQGREVISYPDGLPSQLRFPLPIECLSFTLRTQYGDVTQEISES